MSYELEGEAAKVVHHGRYVAFQMAEVAIPRQMFQEILWLIAELRPQPHQRRRETPDGQPFTRNRRKECVQTPVKIARSAPQAWFGLPTVTVAVTTSVL